MSLDDRGAWQIQQRVNRLIHTAERGEWAGPRDTRQPGLSLKVIHRQCQEQRAVTSKVFCIFFSSTERPRDGKGMGWGAGQVMAAVTLVRSPCCSGPLCAQE